MPQQNQNGGVAITTPAIAHERDTCENSVPCLDCARLPEESECLNCGDNYLRYPLVARVQNPNLWTNPNHCSEECRECSRECGDCGYNPCECDSDDDFRLGRVERMYFGGNSEEYQSRNHGRIVRSVRVFSAELECYYPDGDSMREVASKLPRGIGIASDGSLEQNGVEFQTPKLKGAKGEEVLSKVCKTLQSNGFTVDSRAGLHIHLDGRGLLPKTRTTVEPIALKQLWGFYHAFDDVILSFLPQSRRSNSFCRPTKRSAKLEEIVACKTLEQLEQLWYKTRNAYSIKSAKAHKFHDSRYGGLNLHCLLSDGHLEIRFHSGTLRPRRVLEWTNLHQRIADLAAQKKLSAVLEINTAVPATLADQTKTFFVLLGLSASSRKYFEGRQKAFSGTTRNGEEDAVLVAERA